MKKLKILMVHPHDIYSTSEPWTIRITSLAKEFSKLGHDVKLVYFPLDKKDREIVKPQINEYETIPYFRRRIDIPSNAIKMLKLAKWADVIHFQKCYPEAALPAVISAFLTGTHLHYDWDDWEYKIYVLPSPSRRPIHKTEAFLLNLLENNLPKLADTVSVASEELLDMALSCGIKKNQVIKVSVSADLDRFNPKNKGGNIIKKYGLKKPLVTYLGQLHGAQYAELFIKSAKAVSSKNQNANFVVIGGGDDLGRLKRAAQKLKLRNLKFTGFVSDDDVNKLLAASDIAVACFIDTKQQRCKSPLKISEYMASGKAIVASRVGEVTNMIGNAGLLVSPDDYMALADGIVRLLNNDELRKNYEIAARKRAEKFSWIHAAKKLLVAYSRPYE